MRFRQSVASEAGVALALTLAFVLVGTIIAGTLVASALNEYQSARLSERSRQTFQITEAGVEKAIFEVRRDPDWDDNVGATAHPSHVSGDTTTWYPLSDDPTATTASPSTVYVVNRSFPSSAALGQITVELRGASSGDAAGCAPESCIVIRGTGRISGTSRRIEVLVAKLGPDFFPLYSGDPVNVGAGGGGNGVFTVHGGIYIGNCQTMRISGRNYCVALNMQGNAAILNDRPFFGDTAGAEPYHNRVFAHGMITGQGNSWQIGLDSQLMWGVHARDGWLPAGDNQIDAYTRDNNVPVIAFPDASILICRVYPACQTGYSQYGPVIVPANATVAYECTQAGGCSPGQWTPLSLTSSSGILNLRGGAKIVVPDDAGGAPAINCRANGASASQCNSAGGPSVSGRTDFSLVFDGFATNTSVANLFVQDDAFIHVRTRVLVNATARYDGRATFLIECSTSGPGLTCSDLDANTAGPNRDMGVLEIRAGITPACAASQGANCLQTFGTSGGDGLSFAVGPPSPPAPGARAGGIYLVGANVEVNAILLANGRMRNRNPETWYGMFMANLLDFNQNPQIHPAPGLRDNLPPGLAELFQGTGGILTLRWREVF